MQGGIAGGQAGKPVAAGLNIRLKLAFDGTAYFGWQIQSNRPTIQGMVGAAIEKVTGKSVNLIGCGRTDAGTHARGLVANFRTAARMPVRAWVPALNRLLPPDIRVLSARRAAPGFHARFSAKSKTYRYQIYRAAVLPPHLVREHYHYPYPLDLTLMKDAARRFLGEHDFAAFAARSGERAPREGGTDREMSTLRSIYSSELKGGNARLVYEVEGNGFLHHMVRNMIGTLLELGRGRMSMAEFEELFHRRDRTLAGFTAPARGLILVRVRYGHLS